jgi:hypothetical protein
MAQDIATLIGRLLKIPARLEAVVRAYLLALMVDADKHSLRLAGQLSGLDRSQFSRLLARHVGLAVDSLIAASQGFATTAAKSRKPLVAGAPWTIAIIVDAMLHPRSSPKLSNAQTFTHGRGYVVGHQWTNIVIFVGGQLIPLPPIPFLTKKECRRRGIKYVSANEAIRTYLDNLQLAKWVGSYKLDEVVVMADSGYDDKKLQRLVIDKGWDFLIALKANRSCRSVASEKYRKIKDLFRATKRQAPWKSVRFEVDGGKRRARYRARKLTGLLRGVHREVALICSEKASKRGRRYLACSRPSLDVGIILRAYRTRWLIELFASSAKSVGEVRLRQPAKVVI